MRAVRFVTWMVMLAGLVGWAAQPRCAWACSCLPPGSPAQERDRAAAVFVGRVEQIDAPANPGGEPVQVTFTTLGVWKGDVGASTVVQTAFDSAACGVAFEQGQEYLVYALQNDSGALETSLCSRTQSTATATDALEALGPEQAAPTSAPPTSTPPASTPSATPQASALPSPSTLPDTAGEDLLSANLGLLVAADAMGMLGIAWMGYALCKPAQ